MGDNEDFSMQSNTTCSRRKKPSRTKVSNSCERTVSVVVIIITTLLIIIANTLVDMGL